MIQAVLLAAAKHGKYYFRIKSSEVIFGRERMSLYAIGDLHLHFQSQLKPGHPQLKDRAWKNHEE